MLTRDLIKKLEELDRNDPVQPSEIMIDVFSPVGRHLFEYRGFDKDIVIQRSGDGVYPILTAFVEPRSQK
jgi:hypothetical protein